MASSVEATRPRSIGAPPFPEDIAITAPARRTSDHTLASLVEDEVIPRLMMAHRVDAGDAPGNRARHDELDFEGFAPLALECDARDLLGRLDRLMARGVGVESIMIDVLAPAARRLGTWWEEDRCDFVEVTMGLWRLQEVVRELSSRAPPPFGLAGHGRPRRALFAAFPGDQHDFGTVMVGELFHRNGWDVETLLGAEMPDLLVEVGRHHYDLVGLTVSCDCHRDRIPSAILAVRSVSRNPRVRVMIGGRLFVDDPALAGEVGADGTAADARQALVVADMLIDALEREVVACG